MNKKTFGGGIGVGWEKAKNALSCRLQGWDGGGNYVGVGGGLRRRGLKAERDNDDEGEGKSNMHRVSKNLKKKKTW